MINTDAKYKSDEDIKSDLINGLIEVDRKAKEDYNAKTDKEKVVYLESCKGSLGEVIFEYIKEKEEMELEIKSLKRQLTGVKNG